MKKFYATDLGYVLIWSIFYVVVIGLALNYVESVLPGTLNDVVMIVVTTLASVVAAYLMLNLRAKQLGGKKKSKKN
jgi:hypothetical protein